jgi:hypothetical protein
MTRLTTKLRKLIIAGFAGGHPVWMIALTYKVPTWRIDAVIRHALRTQRRMP